MALSAATQEVVWLNRLLSDIKATPQMPVVIKEDNQGTIAVARNPISHNRTKHIDIKFHYVREALEDILTKPLTRQRFETLRLEMGLKNLSGSVVILIDFNDLINGAHDF